MLKLRLRVRRIDDRTEETVVAVANSGFSGARPQLLLPESVVRKLRLKEVAEPTVVSKRTADGRIVGFVCYERAAKVCVIAEDRTSDEVIVDVLVGGVVPLMNDALISALNVVIIDAKSGIWCFRDELGRVERRGV